MKDPVKVLRKEDIALFDKYRLKDKSWTYKPIKINSLRDGGGVLVMTQQEALDLSKLVRMDLRTGKSATTLLDAPTKVEMGHAVNKFLDEVLEASQKKGSPDIGIIYQRKKIALLEKLEKQQKKFESKLEDGEAIDFDAYKKVREVKEDGKMVPVKGRDGKEVKDYDPEKIILLTKVDDFRKGLGAEGQLLDGAMSQVASNAALPAAKDSKMLRDKLESMPKNPNEIG